MIPAETGPLVIRTVGVIGAGLAGREFARECIRAGYAVVLEDVMPAKLRQAERELIQLVGTEGVGSLELATTVDDAVRSADLVVDFVPDELESKLEIFSMADRMAPPRTILLTPTQTLSISDLASCVYRPDRCLAVQSFNNEHLEIVAPLGASPAVLEAVSVLLRRLGRTVSVAVDTSFSMLTKSQV